MNQKGLAGLLIAEVFGTFILILLGDGVVANVGLAPRLESGAYNWETIAIGWAFAVIVAVFVVGGVSGAHINPAVTVALAVKRQFPWSQVIPFILAQIVGAFLGAAAVYLIYRDGLIAAGMPNVWCTGPGSIFSQAWWGETGSYAAGAAGSYSLLTAGVAEFFGTMVLLWGVMASGDERNLGQKMNLGPYLVGFTVLAIGLSHGGPSGYAINPARDLGPRIFGSIVGTAGLWSDLAYALIVPVLIPIIAGAVGIFLYDWFVSAYLPEPKK